MSDRADRILAGLREVLEHTQRCQPLDEGTCPTCGLVVHRPDQSAPPAEPPP